MEFNRRENGDDLQKRPRIDDENVDLDGAEDGYTDGNVYFDLFGTFREDRKLKNKRVAQVSML